MADPTADLRQQLADHEADKDKRDTKCFSNLGDCRGLSKEARRWNSRNPRGPTRPDFAYKDLKSTGFQLDLRILNWICGFLIGFVDFSWICGFYIGFVDFTLDLWILHWICGFYTGICGFYIGFVDFTRWISDFLHSHNQRFTIQDPPPPQSGGILHTLPTAARENSRLLE